MNTTDNQPAITQRGLIETVGVQYLQEGIAVTILDGKKPLLRDWQKTRLSVEEFRIALERLWSFHGSCNLGVVLGELSGLCCIDVDPRNGGMTWLIESELELGQPIRETTGSGGEHLYYRLPKGGVPNRGGQVGIAPGVELLADGRQAVTWPSIHPCGVPYVIERGLTLVDAVAEADELPAWIIEQAGKPRFQTNGHAGTLGLDADHNVRRVREVLARRPAAVQGQGGDHKTFQAGCICRDFGLSKDAAWPLMLEYNARAVPPWSDDELRDKLENAYKYAKGEAGKESPEKQFEKAPLPEEGEEEPLDEKQAEQQEWDLLPIKDLLKRVEICAELFLSTRDGTLFTVGEEGYWHSEHREIWDFMDRPRLQAEVRKAMLAKRKDAREWLTPTKVRAISDVVAWRTQLETMPRFDSWLDADHHYDYLRVKNGILDLRARELLPHSHAWFSFSKLPFAYEPEAQCPSFLAFLESVWPGDADMKDCLQLWFGYMLLGDTSQQRFAALIGESRAGKGTLARVIECLLGKNNIASLTMTHLASDFGLAHLLGKKLGIFFDAQNAKGGMGDVATERIISIVGEDTQVVNRKNKDAITVELPVKIMLVCNELPQFVNKRSALTNRILVFPFQKSFAGKEDFELTKRLFREMPGILNWALEGAKRIAEGEKLRQPESGAPALTEIKKMLDPMLGFIEDCIEIVDPTLTNDRSYTKYEVEHLEFVPSRLLFTTYQKWCNDNGHRSLGSTRFSHPFFAACKGAVSPEDGNVKWVDKKATRVVYNIRLKPAWELAETEPIHVKSVEPNPEPKAEEPPRAPAQRSWFDIDDL